MNIYEKVLHKLRITDFGGYSIAEMLYSALHDI